MELKKADTTAMASPDEPIAETTTDAFHNDAFRVVQPKTSGHRAGLDALLLAASVPQNANGLLADFGAGVGVAGFAALNLNLELNLLAIEKNAQIAAFASQALDLKKNHFLRHRTQITVADITANGTERLKAGLEPDSVMHGIMNPPYNKANLRQSPDALRTEAYMLGEGGIDAWFRTAASMIRPGGTLSIIYRTENIGEVLACTQGRFGGLEILPIHSRAEEPAKRIIVRGTRGSRAPASLLPGFTIHEADGSFTHHAEEIFTGKAYLKFSS